VEKEGYTLHIRPADGGQRYILHVHTVYGENAYTLHVQTVDGYTLHVHIAGGGKGYTLHIYVAGGGEGYAIARPHHTAGVLMDTPCTSTMQALERGIPCASTVLTVE
jgi:hypothetical protein